MAQSNRHWPSMFKSKPCTNQNHRQWQHDTNSSLLCCKSSSTPVSEERSPEPKPRWNPRPEQIRILEAIFNSGLVNPPRDEIRRIRVQLQEYGQVGDANVFYWFQNRKSRSKHKNRLFPASRTSTSLQSQSSSPATGTAPTSSSSSSSEKSSPGNEKSFATAGAVAGVVEMSNSPTGSVNQICFKAGQTDLLHESFLLPAHQVAAGSANVHGPCFSDYLNFFQVPESGIPSCTGLLHELMNQELLKQSVEKPKPLNDFCSTATPAVAAPPIDIDSSQGFAGGIFPAGGISPACRSRVTVFINDVAFEVDAGPVNLREAFGEDAVLVHASGQPVATNEWGVTVHALQHGGFYYLV